MSNEQSQLSSTASRTTTRGSSSPAGLPDETLRKVHAAAIKQAGPRRNAKPVGRPNLKMTPSVPRESREEIEQRQRRVKTRDGLLQSGAPLRHLRNAVEPRGKWGECYSKLAAMLGSGFLVVLMGKRWTGKTQMATELIRCAVRRAIEKDREPNARFVTMMQFFMAIKEAYKPDGPTESAQVDSFAAPGLLVIDEAHERSDTDWERRLLNEMLNHRYNAMKDTLLMTNMTPEAFAESIGPTIHRRIEETGLEIVCDWPSFRDPDNPDHRSENRELRVVSA